MSNYSAFVVTSFPLALVICLVYDACRSLQYNTLIIREPAPQLFLRWQFQQLYARDFFDLLSENFHHVDLRPSFGCLVGLRYHITNRYLANTASIPPRIDSLICVFVSFLYMLVFVRELIAWNTLKAPTTFWSRAPWDDFLIRSIPPNSVTVRICYKTHDKYIASTYSHSQYHKAPRMKVPYQERTIGTSALNVVFLFTEVKTDFPTQLRTAFLWELEKWLFINVSFWVKKGSWLDKYIYCISNQKPLYLINAIYHSVSWKSLRNLPYKGFSPLQFE